MSNEIKSVFSVPSSTQIDRTYTTVFTPNLSGLGPADAASELTKYLTTVAQVSISDTNFNAAFNLGVPERAAIGASQIIVGAMGDNPTVRDFSGTIPIPNTDTLNVDFDAALVQVKDVVDSLEQSWLLKYFPAALPEGLDPLLQQITSGTIVTNATQEILWERAKQQGNRENARLQDEAITLWAARGFSLPGGAINATANKNQQALFFANADFAAQQALKALDIQVESTKFAAEIGTRLRLGLIDGLTGLVNAYSRLPSAAADYATGVSNARRAGLAAVSDYYNTLIQNANLSLRADEANADLHHRYLNTAASFMGASMSANVSAATASLDAYARTAAATISSLNNVTSIGIQSTTG
jgi:hypothetical protein